MLFGKMNPTLRGILLVVLAILGLAAMFVLIGIIDVALDTFNPSWIIKAVLVIAFFVAVYFIEKDEKKENDDE